MKKPILCLDFDGVLHSYTSGWKGARVIPNAPVPGAIEWLLTAVEFFEVNIFSSRSHQFGGRRAMRRWLEKQFWAMAALPLGEAPKEFVYQVGTRSFTDPKWMQDSVKSLMRDIKFPRHKPAAMVTLDDRAIQFTGVFPPVLQLRKFKPWDKK